MRVSRYYVRVRELEGAAEHFEATFLPALVEVSGTSSLPSIMRRVINSRVPIPLQFVILALSFFPTYAAVETMLSLCRWSGAAIPTIGAVVVGVCGPLLIGLVATMFSASVAHTPR